ncbi:MAG: SEL1-like repeat protein [Magnetococcales bacterium]|nr:SEL1-like repeat protein [Magnetococcales bacterium]
MAPPPRRKKKAGKFHEALAPGAYLHQYKIVKVLGQGNFGLTYLAEDDKLAIQVAVKEYFPREIALRDATGLTRPKSSQDEDNYQTGLKRFLQEARTLAGFRHPNIVRVLNFFETNQTAYIVMEYEKGESLAALFRRALQRSEPELVKMATAITDGLHVLHSAGFLHRDIKPENIYIRDADQSPVLLDFGASRHAMGEETKTLTTFLTPGYAPFEQYYASSKTQGPWTDLYALGGVLYRAISGDRPLPSTERSSALLRGSPDPLPQATMVGKGYYSLPFLQAVDHALAILENKRPQSAKAWQEELLASTGKPTPSGVTELGGVQLAHELETIQAVRADQGGILPPTEAPTLHAGFDEAATLIATADEAATVVMPPDPSTTQNTVETRTINGAPPKQGKKASFLQIFLLLALIGLGTAVYLHRQPPSSAKRGFSPPQEVEEPASNDYEGVMAKAHEAYAREEYAQAVRWLEQAMVEEEPDAPVYLAEMYLEGQGVEHDELEAAKLFMKAAEGGHTHAQFRLAELLIEGRGVTQDYDLAMLWLRKSAEAGEVPAKARLGDILASGEGGVEPNPEEAAEWLLEAAEAEDPWARFRLGELYRDGLGVEQDVDLAVKLFQLAASQNEPPAQMALGEAYMEGHGIHQDLQQGAAWFHKAAENGDPWAQVRLAELYAQGRGVVQNSKRATFWNQKASAAGDPLAQYRLGLAMLEGQGVAKNESEGIRLMEQAANSGEREARMKLGELYLQGRGVFKDPEKAAYWFRMAAED